jgi:hypothetical protein
VDGVRRHPLRGGFLIDHLTALMMTTAVCFGMAYYRSAAWRRSGTSAFSYIALFTFHADAGDAGQLLQLFTGRGLALTC